MLTTQYLMDNVLVAVSEAKFKMKSKGKESLGDFIDELKSIWIRGNYRPCFDEARRKEYFGDVAPLIWTTSHIIIPLMSLLLDYQNNQQKRLNCM